MKQDELSADTSSAVVQDRGAEFLHQLMSFAMRAGGCY